METVSKVYCENNENSNIAEQSSALQIVLTQSRWLRQKVETTSVVFKQQILYPQSSRLRVIAAR